MSPCKNKRGYLRVNLVPPEGSSYRTFRVHRLVLEAFIGQCPNGMEGRHLNGIKTDCNLSNLAWGTPEQNRQDNRDLDVYARGSKHSQAKLTECDIRIIRKRYAEGVFLRILSDEYKVSIQNIHAIVQKRSWKHVD